MEFSLNRVSRLLKLQWAENKRTYLLGMLSVCSIVFIVGLIAIEVGNYNEEFELMIFSILLALSGAFFTCTLLATFTPKSKSIRTLMLPVSAAERIITALASALVFPPVFYALVFPVIVVLNYINNGFNVNYNFYISENISGEKIYYYLLLQLWVVMLSVFFRTKVFIKIALSIIVPVICLMLLAQRVINLFDVDALPQAIKSSMYQNVNSSKRIFSTNGSLNFEQLSFFTDKPETLLIEHSEREKALFNILSCLLIPLLITTTWLRLREKQL